MDNFTFEILEKIYENRHFSPNDTTDNPDLLDRKHEAYNLLVDNGYVLRNNKEYTFKITIKGSAYVEERRKNNHLMELHEQNIDIQASLRNCQRLLIFIAFLQFLHTLDVSFVHIFDSFERFFTFIAETFTHY